MTKDEFEFLGIKHFTYEELACTHTGEMNLSVPFLKRLEKLREVCNFPFNIVSGYRHPSHPIEARKQSPGPHSRAAVDILARGPEMRTLVRNALVMNFHGIGVNNGSVHVDDDSFYRATEPTMWGYKKDDY